MVENKRRGGDGGGEHELERQGGRGGQGSAGMQRSEPQRGTLERGGGGGRGSNPFAMMSQLSQEMDRLFDDFWLAPFGRSLRRGGGREGGEVASMLWSPDIEVHEHEGEIVVRADLPGLKREDVQVEVADQVLTIQGERKLGCEEKQDGWHRTECRYGSFFRSIPLGEDVDPERVQAQFEDGVLEIRMPAPQRKESRRRIEVRGREKTERQ
jgi:HSP20 family protein